VLFLSTRFCLFFPLDSQLVFYHGRLTWPTIHLSRFTDDIKALFSVLCPLELRRRVCGVFGSSLCSDNSFLWCSPCPFFLSRRLFPCFGILRASFSPIPYGFSNRVKPTFFPLIRPRFIDSDRRSFSLDEPARATFPFHGHTKNRSSRKSTVFSLPPPRVACPLPVQVTPWSRHFSTSLFRHRTPFSLSVLALNVLPFFSLDRFDRVFSYA